MAITLTPLTSVFAAECSGVDIGQPLDAATAREIEAAMDRYAVLVFRRDAPLTDAQQLAFTLSFGQVEPPYQVPTAQSGGGGRRLPATHNDISNLDPTGKLLARDDRRRLYNLGNMLWHSDSSFKATPAKWSLLSAHVVPPEGADTEFADMRAAWDALDPRTQAEVRDLVAEHSLLHSRAQLGFADYTEEERRLYAPVRQRLVRRHPGSGRLSLYLSSHIGDVLGWPRPEAMMLIRDLTEHATQREFVYRHKWRAGDLVVWDNRCTMHRARRFDDTVHKRDLRRTTLQDAAPTLEQAA
jgi:alpha-ketoglutarate-dependent 2,4-dichlorophenoxyacetate dioxygenase